MFQVMVKTSRLEGNLSLEDGRMSVTFRDSWVVNLDQRIQQKSGLVLEQADPPFLTLQVKFVTVTGCVAKNKSVSH